ncbi:unnamed protein product [Discula destructiva]
MQQWHQTPIADSYIQYQQQQNSTHQSHPPAPHGSNEYSLA